MNKIQFKSFILNENRAYLGEKIGDILASVHDISDGAEGVGARQLIKFCERLVASIRRILHSNWPQTEQKYLKNLQKIGVAIMNSIEQKDDLREILPSIRQELEELSSKIGMPLNTLGTQETKGPEEAPEGKVLKPGGPPGQGTTPPEQPPQPT